MISLFTETHWGGVCFDSSCIDNDMVKSLALGTEAVPRDWPGGHTPLQFFHGVWQGTIS